jgi:hypothetical protein
MDGDILDLYSDYLLASTRKATATGLSELVDKAISHDQITRFLAGEDLNGKTLWLKSNKLIRQYENADGCLIFDDTIVEQLYSQHISPLTDFSHRAPLHLCRAIYGTICGPFYIRPLAKLNVRNYKFRR